MALGEGGSWAGRPALSLGDRSPLPGYREKATLANVRSEGTCPVGSFPRARTAYGCEDMVGNVSEWCRMIEGDDYGRLPKDRPEIGAGAGRPRLCARTRLLLLAVGPRSDACLAPAAAVGDAALGRFSAGMLLTVLSGLIPLPGLLTPAKLPRGVSPARR